MPQFNLPGPRRGPSFPHSTLVQTGINRDPAAFSGALRGYGVRDRADEVPFHVEEGRGPDKYCSSGVQGRAYQKGRRDEPVDPYKQDRVIVIDSSDKPFNIDPGIKIIMTTSKSGVSLIHINENS